MKIPVSELVPGDRILRLDGSEMYSILSLKPLDYEVICAEVQYPVSLMVTDKYWASPDAKVTVDRPEDL